MSLRGQVAERPDEGVARNLRQAIGKVTALLEYLDLYRPFPKATKIRPRAILNGITE